MFNTSIGMSTATLFTKFFMSIAYLLQLLWLFEIFYRNPTSAIFKLSAVPANFNFHIGSIAENVLHSINYLLSNISCFYHILNYFFSRIALTMIYVCTTNTVSMLSYRMYFFQFPLHIGLILTVCFCVFVHSYLYCYTPHPHPTTCTFFNDL